MAVLRLGTGLFLQRRTKPRGRKLPLSESSLKRNMFNSFFFFFLSVDSFQQIKLILFKLSHTRRDKYP